MKILLLFLSLSTCIVKAQPCSVSISIIQNPSCAQCSDGVLQANPSGTPPFSYIWNSTQLTQQIASGLIVATYWVCIEDSTGCQACDSITLTSSVGVQKITTDSPILFSPNPFTDNLMLSASEDYLLTVFNSIGETILEKSISSGDQTTLNTAFLSAGIYFIRVRTESSSIITKVIKE